MASRAALAQTTNTLPSVRHSHHQVLHIGKPIAKGSEQLAMRLPPMYMNCMFMSTLNVLLSELVLNFGTLAFTGLALKWDLTFGDEAPHHHPHIPEESYIQRPNNLLSIVMVSNCFSFAEAIILLSIYCRNKGRGDDPHCNECCYKTIRLVAVFFSWLCIILSGMSLAACWALQMEMLPPDLRFIGCDLPSSCVINCPGGVPPLPPPPPPPVSPVLPSGELYLLYALCGALSLLKFFSYALGIPQKILQWHYNDVYAPRPAA